MVLSLNTDFGCVCAGHTFCTMYNPSNIRFYEGGVWVKKITGRVFVRAEQEAKSSLWENLTKEETMEISECINRDAAHAGGFRELGKTA